MLEKLQPQGKKYKDGFAPSFHPNEFNRRFKPDDFVFVSDMGDIAFAQIAERQAIADYCANFPETRFLLQTKDPWIFEGHIFNKPNFYLGVTLETNRPYPVTQAPTPFERYIKIQSGTFKVRFVSIEPIMDFDLKTLMRWIGHIKPEIVEVGADNYSNHLVEPPWEKVEALLESLRKFVPRVVEKDGLERLKGK